MGNPDGQLLPPLGLHEDREDPHPENEEDASGDPREKRTNHLLDLPSPANYIILSKMSSKVNYYKSLVRRK